MLLYENTDFFRVSDEGTVRISLSAPSKRVKTTISLAPLKTVALSSFSFPFSNGLRVREALKIQALPYASAGEFELFPALIEKGARNCSGVAWFVPVGELEAVKAPLPHVENRVWPAPLPLGVRVGGEGLTIWLDEGQICSMLWREGVPVLYRWKARPKATVESEQAWFEAYARAEGKAIGEVFILDAAASEGRELLPGIIQEALSRFPWIGDLNLSRSALDSALGLERAVRLGTKVASWLLVLGIFVLSGTGFRYFSARQELQAVRARSETLYRETFDPSRTGRIADPLGLARSKMAELSGGSSEGRPIYEVFAQLGTILDTSSMDVTLDSLSYNLDGVDFTGSAPDTQTIQDFQRTWAENAKSAQVMGINNLPGVGFRFDLNIKW